LDCLDTITTKETAAHNSTITPASAILPMIAVARSGVAAEAVHPVRKDPKDHKDREVRLAQEARKDRKVSPARGD